MKTRRVLIATAAFFAMLFSVTTMSSWIQSSGSKNEQTANANENTRRADVQILD